jgi:hypothetical protein
MQSMSKISSTLLLCAVAALFGNAGCATEASDSQSGEDEVTSSETGTVEDALIVAGGRRAVVGGWGYRRVGGVRRIGVVRTGFPIGGVGVVW